MTLLDLLLRSSLLLALATALVALRRRDAAAHRHLIWMLALAGLIALPAMKAVVPPIRVLPAIAAPAAVPAPAANPRGVPATQVVARHSVARAAETSVNAPASPRFSWRNAASFGLKYWWAFGLVLATWRLAVARVALLRLVRRARPVKDDATWLALDDAATRLGVTVPVKLIESDLARMPMTFGLRRAVIVLPPGFRDWTDEQRDVVLLHELAHIRRGDARANLLSQLVCSFYWFHPLVWTAAKRLRIEAERACDDMVLHAGAVPSAYAAQLLAMVQSVLNVRAPALALPLAQRSAFEGRVLAILETGVTRKPLSARMATAGTLLLFAVAVPLAALAPASAQEPLAAHRHSEREPGLMPEPTPTPQPTPGIAMPMPTPQPAPSPTPAGFGRQRQETRTHVVVQTHTSRRQGDPAVLAAFMTALQDSDEGVREAAAHSLGNMGDTAAVDALVNALRHDASKDVRKTAAWALGQIEDRRAVPGLTAALRDERDVEVRRQVAWALGQIESEDAVPGIGAALRSESDAETRRMLVWSLGQIESKASVPYLTPLLRDSDAETREKTAWALGQIESGDAVEAIAAAYAAEHVDSVKEQLLWALGQIEDARAVPTLVIAMRDSSVEIRKKALWALGQIDGGGADVAQALLNAMKDSDPEIRRLAARALGNR